MSRGGDISEPVYLKPWQSTKKSEVKSENGDADVKAVKQVKQNSPMGEQIQFNSPGSLVHFR